VFTCEFSNSQPENRVTEAFSLSNAGLSIGWYNPSMDYWKDSSGFKDADFKGAIDVNAFLDLRLVNNFHGKIGLGYWQESVKDSLQSFGNTNLLLTGIPISIDLFYQIKPFSFSIVTPYLGAGGEFLFVQHKVKFELNNDPAAKTGSTVMGHLMAGFETKLSSQFAIDVECQYKFGDYKQDFKIEDPTNPGVTNIVTETISLNGPRIGITFKYFL
jgi:hypothetical protein